MKSFLFCREKLSKLRAGPSTTVKIMINAKAVQRRVNESYPCSTKTRPSSLYFYDTRRGEDRGLKLESKFNAGSHVHRHDLLSIEFVFRFFFLY